MYSCGSAVNVKYIPFAITTFVPHKIEGPTCLGAVHIGKVFEGDSLFTSGV